MLISAFFSTAKTYAEKIKKEKPVYANVPGSSLCMIMADNQEIYSAISSINIFEGNVADVHSERTAIAEIIAANRVAKQMVIVSFEELSAVLPCDECIDMLIRANSDNGQCEIATSPEDSTKAITLKAQTSSVSEEFLNEKADSGDKSSTSSLGAPAEFVSGFEFDESNPFYEPPASSDDSEESAADSGPKFLYSGPNQPNPADNPQAMYGQQQMYQQQGGFPQQQMYQQQGGFPQQQMYQQQGGFPQQQMYQQQGGFPQQQMYQQQGGFPQQQYGQQAAMPQQPGALNNQSVHISDVIGAAHNQFQPDLVVSQYSDAGGDNVMKKRLASLLCEDDDEDEKTNNATMSKDDLMKQSKDQKKAAKQSSLFRKQF